MKINLINIILVLLVACSAEKSDLQMKVVELEEVSTTIDHSVFSSLGGMSNHGSFIGDNLGSFEKSIALENRELANVVANENNILVVDLKGYLLYLSSKDFSVIWRSKIKVFSYHDPIIYKSKIYLVSYSGTVYEINADNGEIINKTELNSHLRYRPLVLNSFVYLINSNGELLRLSDKHNIDIVANELPTYGKWIVLNGKIYLVANNGKLLAIDSDGNIGSYNVLANGEYAISGGLSYIFLKGKNLKVLSVNSMEEVYSSDINYGYSESVSLDSKEVFVYSESGNFNLLSFNNFMKLWEGHLGSNIEYKPIIIGNEILLASKKSLYILDKLTGDITKELFLDTQILYQPVFTNNAVFIITYNGLLKISSPSLTSYTPEVYDILSVGELKRYPLLMEGITLRLNPVEDREYNIHSPTMEDFPVEIEILSKDNKSLNKNVGYVSYQEDFINTFYKGDTYYIHCRALSDEVGDFSLIIK